ncbi:aspartyl protease AED3-like protein [Cinnamomum micranthum f. kanehirae]|uniref:Aspartyl protease AED3-like protein n=1 Tax=Cinnamomum micranthum f. kanehirae TaxID=337451 RepID=A0A3S3NAX1_9MAGN|nr:aspartyl protease AED3-like protein [Cinnamomum micranthum f. kanehirae]
MEMVVLLRCTLLLLLSSLSWLHEAHGSGPGCAATQHGSDITVMHPYGPCSPFPQAESLSWEQALFQMNAEDDARLLYLGNLQVVPRPKGRKRTFVPIASGRQTLQSTAYIVRVSVGTPPQAFLMALDISNDAAWIPCSGCLGCSSTVFTSATSTSYKTLPCQAPQCKQVPNPSCLGSTCSFNMTYGSSSFSANLSQDTMTLAGDSVPFYTFGCLNAVTGVSVPPQGLLGLGRGPTSLLSQTQNIYHSTFSYCLPSFKSLNFSGTLRLGTAGQPIRIKTTPLLRNPRRPSLYYVNLMGISVGRRLVDIPPNALAFDPVTGAGTIIDSGTAVTRLVEPAYVAVRDAFRRRVKGTVTSLGGFDTCYNGPIMAPTMKFHFAGMNMSLGGDNLLIHSTAGSITCLAMAAAPANVNSVLNVIANMQQQNHRVLFDVPNSRVGVSRELCT